MTFIRIGMLTFSMYPQIVKDTVRNRRIIRICSSSTSLNVTTQYQTKYHNNEDNLQKLKHAQVLERIPGLVLEDGDAGGIKVPELTIDHRQLCANIIHYLETKRNVQFKWLTQVRSIDVISSSKIIFA